MAELAVREGSASGTRTMDAIGPETYTYRQLIAMLSDAIGIRRPIVSVSPFLGYATARLFGLVMRDVVLTREEIAGLMADLLCTDSNTAGSTSLKAWAIANRENLGRRYASELRRRRDRLTAYGR